MKRSLCVAFCLALLAAPAAAAPESGADSISVAEIISKNVAARGGLKAWRAARTLTLSGRLDDGVAEDPELPFLMKMKRPHKSRLELHFQDQTTLQIYDGEHGWKVRPLQGHNEIEPYTPAEARDAEAWQELDGPLVDHARRGASVSLLGREAVEGHDAYALKLTLKSGEERRVWVDAASFLERKMDGEPFQMDGRLRHVTIYYRDFKPEHGLVMPHVFEMFVEGGQQSRKLIIDRVTVNQPMDDSLFRPEVPLVRTAKKRAPGNS